MRTVGLKVAKTPAKGDNKAPSKDTKAPAKGEANVK